MLPLPPIISPTLPLHLYLRDRPCKCVAEVHIPKGKILNNNPSVLLLVASCGETHTL